MDFIQILVLALVQGLTEFLPVSSSAHLILVPIFTGWQDQTSYKKAIDRLLKDLKNTSRYK